MRCLEFPKTRKEIKQSDTNTLLTDTCGHVVCDDPKLALPPRTESDVRQGTFSREFGRVGEEVLALGTGEEVDPEMSDGEGSGGGIDVVGQKGTHERRGGRGCFCLAGRVDLGYVEYGAGCRRYMVEERLDGGDEDTGRVWGRLF